MFTNLREDITRASALYGDAAAHPYIHLADGGLSDNLGMRGMLNYVAQQGGWGNFMSELRHAGFDKIALVVVNAAVVTTQNWDLVPDTPTSTVIRAVSNALVNQSNRSMLGVVRTQPASLAAAATDTSTNPATPRTRRCISSTSASKTSPTRRSEPGSTASPPG